MKESTASGANSEITRTITFSSEAHREFYLSYLPRCRYQDVYHKALVYCLGIDRDTRKHVDRIYDFETGCIKTRCLQEGWQTSGSSRIVRLAFNLYCNNTPSVNDYRKTDDKIKECQMYAVEELFCCSYAPFFWEAIRLRYPEYCQ